MHHVIYIALPGGGPSTLYLVHTLYCSYVVHLFSPFLCTIPVILVISVYWDKIQIFLTELETGDLIWAVRSVFC